MRILRIAALAAVAAGGALLLAPATGAQASDAATCNRVHQQSGPNGGLVNLLNGNNVNAPVDADLSDFADLGLIGTSVNLLGGTILSHPTAASNSTRVTPVNCGN
jgi:hypothetical protein